MDAGLGASVSIGEPGGLPGARDMGDAGRAATDLSAGLEVERDSAGLCTAAETTTAREEVRGAGCKMTGPAGGLDSAALNAGAVADSSRLDAGAAVDSSAGAALESSASVGMSAAGAIFLRRQGFRDAPVDDTVGARSRLRDLPAALAVFPGPLDLAVGWGGSSSRVSNSEGSDSSSRINMLPVVLKVNYS
jgi:hypothetical protein